ncbi:MAG: hypothetical protein ABIB43_05705 [archaeon]
MGTLLNTYLTLYILGSAVVVTDYELSHKKWLENNTKSSIVTKDYSVEANGETKNLTLMGEIHLYNPVESEFSENLIKNYDLVLHEGSNKQCDTKIDEYFWKYNREASKVMWKYVALANNRNFENPGLNELAYNNKIPVLYLENNTNGGTGDMGVIKKTLFATSITSGVLMAPLKYLFSKIDTKSGDENPLDDGDSAAGWICNVDLRDCQMYNEAINYLNERPEDDILIVVGKGHFRGMDCYLTSNPNITPK